MRSRNLVSFGIGLCGLGVALGSVCRPRTTGSSVAAPVTVSTSVDAKTILPTSTFPETSLTSTAVSGSSETFTEFTTTNLEPGLSTTEASVEVSTTEASGGSTATSLDTSIAVSTSVDLSSTVLAETPTTPEDTGLLPTTEAKTLETSIAVTTLQDIPTTTLAETTATSDSPSHPTLFDLIASTGPAADRTLQIEPIPSFAPYFISPDAGRPSTSLSWDSVTGRLLVPGTPLSICVVYSRDRETAQVRVCPSNVVAPEYLVCDAPAGTTLQCRAPACAVVMKPFPADPRVSIPVKECYSDQQPWTQFYTRKETISSSWKADFGPEGILDPDLTPMELRIAGVQ